MATQFQSEHSEVEDYYVARFQDEAPGIADRYFLICVKKHFLPGGGTTKVHNAVAEYPNIEMAREALRSIQ